ncbi:hypothetical protein [Paenibacillus xylanexedens]|uniref:hypothetical protein n=1 Tax=Paenibacillus xylanexedens TaxID=528191 RepID=UPI0011A7D8A0|nr:hypothetical protein [Paenibacillus xylanexedens]
MSKFDVVAKLKDGFEIRVDGIDGNILKIGGSESILNQISTNFITGLVNNSSINVNDDDGNTRHYKFDDLASITINFVGEGE